MRVFGRPVIVLFAGALVATASMHVEQTASAESPGLSAARRWALATSAVLTTRNRERHDLLGGIGSSICNGLDPPGVLVSASS